ncbi:hypothetical protein ACK39S_16720 [Aeromonas veronii]
MTTTAKPKEKTDLSIPPLLPLEYCRPERAAKLLKCEIEDLFHWAAIGAIKIYVNAARALDGINTAGIRLPKEVSPAFVIKPNPIEGTFKFGAGFNFIRVGKMGSPGYEMSDDGYCHFKVSKLYGFWAIAPLHFWHWEQDGGISNSDEYYLTLLSSFDLSASAYAFDVPDIDITVQVAASFPSLKDNLWLMREDLEQLHLHIHTGQPFPIWSDDKEQCAMTQMLATTRESPSRTTANQSRVIVELLTALGFTDEDYQGSIADLQRKISRQGVSGTLTDVDRSTVKNWLQRAGVRA